MTAVHKRNGGYIGLDYRQPFPSGVHVIGGISRVSEVTIDVELYGGKGSNYFRYANAGAGYGGNGGYTKVRLKVPSSRTLQIRPGYLPSAGGNGTEGGAGSGLLIADEWLAVTGGGGGGGGRGVYTIPSASFSSEAGSNGSQGFGGYGNAVGAGTPSNGGVGQACNAYDNPDTPTYYGFSVTGKGGGGIGGGSANSSGCYGSTNWSNPGPYDGGNGGGGNLRIYQEQSATSGNLTVLPDVYMQYLTHSNGSHTGSAQITVTNVTTSAAYTYTGNKDIKAIYLITGEFNP